jgi:hypothetical protein
MVRRRGGEWEERKWKKGIKVGIPKHLRPRLFAGK